MTIHRYIAIFDISIQPKCVLIQPKCVSIQYHCLMYHDMTIYRYIVASLFSRSGRYQKNDDGEILIQNIMMLLKFGYFAVWPRVLLPAHGLVLNHTCCITLAVLTCLHN